MIRDRYNKKNDDRYLPFKEEHRIRNKSKWSKKDKAKIDKWGKDSHLKYDYLMKQQKAKADITRIIRQLALYGKNDELERELTEAHMIAWPKDTRAYEKMKEEYTVRSR